MMTAVGVWESRGPRRRLGRQRSPARFPRACGRPPRRPSDPARRRPGVHRPGTSTARRGDAATAPVMRCPLPHRSDSAVFGGSSAGLVPPWLRPAATVLATSELDGSRSTRLSSRHCSSAASIPASAPNSGRIKRTVTRSCCWSHGWWSARCWSSGKRRRPPSSRKQPRGGSAGASVGSSDLDRLTRKRIRKKDEIVDQRITRRRCEQTHRLRIHSTDRHRKLLGRSVTVTARIGKPVAGHFLQSRADARQSGLSCVNDRVASFANADSISNNRMVFTRMHPLRRRRWRSPTSCGRSRYGSPRIWPSSFPLPLNWTYEPPIWPSPATIESEISCSTSSETGVQLPPTNPPDVNFHRNNVGERCLENGNAATFVRDRLLVVRRARPRSP